MFLSGKRSFYVKRKFIEHKREDGLYEFFINQKYLIEEYKEAIQKNA